MEETKIYKFSELCSKIGSGATPKGGKESYLGGNIALIRSQNVLDFNFSVDGLAYINNEQAQKLNNVSIEENDVLLNITGDSVARACMAPSWILPARVNQHVAIIRGNADLVLNDYLLYFLQYKKSYLLSISQGGATRNALTKRMIEDIELLLPNLSHQRKVVSILRSLDSKIELNRRINDNLEQQAQALFDHYFDSGSIYLEDSIMGCLTDIAVYLNGLAMQKFPATDIERSLPVLKIKELGQRKCDDCSDRCSDSIDADYIIDNEDIIFSWSGTLMVDVWCGGKCGLNQHLFKVTPLKNYPRWFVYYWTNRHLKKFKLIAKDKAVTMGHIRRGDLENAEVAIPTNLNMLEINARINPLFQSIIDRRLEITKLENIRDALLPKLMSGELTINEI